MKILITGGLGYLGHHLATYFDKLGYDVHLIDKKGITEELLSVSDFTQWENVFKHNLGHDNISLLVNKYRGMCFDYVFHLGETSDIGTHEIASDRDLNQNIATENMIELMRNQVNATLVYASSGVVYGEARVEVDSQYKQVVPSKETDTLNPVSKYAIRKITSENLWRYYSITTGRPVVVLRYGNIFGTVGRLTHRTFKTTSLSAKIESGEQVVLKMIHALASETKEHVYENPYPKRTWCSMKTFLVLHHELIINQNHSSFDIFNLGVVALDTLRFIRVVRREYVAGRDYINGRISKDKFHIGRNELDISKIYKQLINGRKSGTYIERYVELNNIMRLISEDKVNEWSEILNWKQQPTRK